MAATIDRELGRPALVAAMCDPRLLMSTYNRATARANSRGARLPHWDERLLAALGRPGRTLIRRRSN
jgi:hypothetical protein